MQPEGLAWTEYYRASAERGPNPFWARVEPFLPSGGRALDLGAGNGSGTRFLLDRGFEVTAIDSQPESIEYLQGLCPEAEIRLSRFEDLVLEPGAWDVVMGVFAFFFVSGVEFPRFWDQVRGSVRPGGLLGGQLLGPKDDWATRGYAVHTATEVTALTMEFEMIFREEVDRPGQTIQGVPKHWHVHHFLGRRTSD